MTLEQFRKFKGWSYKRLGTFLRCPGETARRYCNGERYPKPKMAKRIADKTEGLVTPTDHLAVVHAR